MRPTPCGCGGGSPAADGIVPAHTRVRRKPRRRAGRVAGPWRTAPHGMLRRPRPRPTQVKSLDRRTEEDVPVAELARYLAAELPRLAALRRDEPGDADEDGSDDAPEEPALRRRSNRR